MSAKKCSRKGWCPNMKLLLDGGHEVGGLNARTLMSVSTGKDHEHPSVIVYLRKDMRKLAGGAFVRLSYCPCCGADIRFDP